MARLFNFLLDTFFDFFRLVFLCFSSGSEAEFEHVEADEHTDDERELFQSDSGGGVPGGVRGPFDFSSLLLSFEMGRSLSSFSLGFNFESAFGALETLFLGILKFLKLSDAFVILEKYAGVGLLN